MNTISKIIASIILIITFTNCARDKNMNGDVSPKQLIFPKGEQVAATNFTGKAYNFGLVPSNSTYNTLIGNVYFEAGARSNWHTHPGGQILIIIDGEGYHQIRGRPKQTVKKGDVIKCPSNTKHWHGASENSSLSQLYIVPNTEKGIVTWLEPVTDEQYNTGN
jgi:quercetin dioxygenase-like cupin family protein